VNFPSNGSVFDDRSLPRDRTSSCFKRKSNLWPDSVDGQGRDHIQRWASRTEKLPRLHAGVHERLAVDVQIVPSNEAPSGCGEPPVPVISRAVVNALYRLTGKRYRSLPLNTL